MERQLIEHNFGHDLEWLCQYAFRIIPGATTDVRNALQLCFILTTKAGTERVDICPLLSVHTVELFEAVLLQPSMREHGCILARTDRACKWRPTDNAVPGVQYLIKAAKDGITQFKVRTNNVRLNGVAGFGEMFRMAAIVMSDGGLRAFEETMRDAVGQDLDHLSATHPAGSAADRESLGLSSPSPLLRIDGNILEWMGSDNAEFQTPTATVNKGYLSPIFARRDHGHTCHLTLLSVGAPICWLVIHPDCSEAFVEQIRRLFPTDVEWMCTQSVEHLRIWPSTAWLDKNRIRYKVVLQQQNQLLVTPPSSYFYGVALGFSIVESTHYAEEGWAVDQLTKREFVLCKSGCQRHPGYITPITRPMFRAMEANETEGHEEGEEEEEEEEEEDYEVDASGDYQASGSRANAEAQESGEVSLSTGPLFVGDHEEESSDDDADELRHLVLDPEEIDTLQDTGLGGAEAEEDPQAEDGLAELIHRRESGDMSSPTWPELPAELGPEGWALAPPSSSPGTATSDSRALGLSVRLAAVVEAMEGESVSRLISDIGSARTSGRSAAYEQDLTPKERLDLLIYFRSETWQSRIRLRYQYVVLGQQSLQEALWSSPLDALPGMPRRRVIRAWATLFDDFGCGILALLPGAMEARLGNISTSAFKKALLQSPHGIEQKVLDLEETVLQVLRE